MTPLETEANPNIRVGPLRWGRPQLQDRLSVWLRTGSCLWCDSELSAISGIVVSAEQTTPKYRNNHFRGATAIIPPVAIQAKNRLKN